MNLLHAPLISTGKYIKEGNRLISTGDNKNRINNKYKFIKK